MAKFVWPTQSFVVSLAHLAPRESAYGEHVQVNGPLQTNSANWTAMTGLTLTIPEGVGIQAIVILNVPNPYATGNNYPGGNLGSR